MMTTDSERLSAIRLTPDRMAAVGIDPEITFDGQRLVIPLFNIAYTLTESRIYGPDNASPPEKISEILINYVFHFPATHPTAGRLISFRELAGAGPLVVSFANNTNKTLMAAFSGRLSELETAAVELGGEPHLESTGFDLALRFQALPGIPLYLHYNEAEPPFPAQCSLLLDASIEEYLDMQTIFTLGTFLCGQLANSLYKDH